MGIETRPGTTKRNRPTPEVLDRFGILVINLEPENNLREQGLAPYTKWFANALGMSPDRFRTVNAIDEGLPLTVPESGIIIGGSSFGVYDQLPWMQRLQEFIRAMADQQKPTLGVCFGHQIVAAALGGTVERGSKGREFGPTQVILTPEGQADPLYRGLPSTLRVAMTHGDVVIRIPQDAAIVLAENPTYSNQSLAFGTNVRTTQFHPEMTGGILASIARHDQINRGTAGTNESRTLLAQLRQADVESHGRAVLRNFAANFVEPFHMGINR